MTLKKTACIGGGVIGGAWAARFVLNGLDCHLFDPHPETQRIVGEVMDNARRATAKLYSATLPAEGKLTFADSLEEAVESADLIQESVPERLELKQKVHMQIDAAAPTDALIGSSTSGLLPTDIQCKMMAPERMFVAHPYNPVYLLPLVEICGGARTSSEALDRAHAAYQSLGMKPVRIRKEIDAFVGDRLLEAVWREALWLIKDDVCTVEELDDIMTHSFGLRWGQMGLFQTYRVAGGEAGMRHFIEQFGPTMSLPWTKLMDVPDLNDALIDKIADQSDEQAGDLSIRDLERIRDDNLVGFLHVLRDARNGDGWAAGKMVQSQSGLDNQLTFDEMKVRRALWNSWSAETAVQWTPSRPFNGQCNVTAAVVADLFGAEILSTPWNEQTDHYYNRIKGKPVDLTDGQFSKPIHYADTPSSHEIASVGFTQSEFDTLKRNLLANLEG